MSRIISLSILTLGCFTFGDYSLADIGGGDRLVANAAGRCWRVVHRDFAIKGHLVAGYSFKMLHVGGTGETDDILTYEFTVKENFSLENGWDESRTRQYTGTGLIKSISNGRIRFELYVDLGNNEDPTTVEGYYHPGNGTSDFDDRIVIAVPEPLQSTAGSSNNDCSETFEEGSNDF